MTGTHRHPETLLDEPPQKKPVERVVPPFQALRAASENTRMMHATLDELVTRKRWVFAAMALAFCLSAAWYWTYPTLYASTVSFYVPAPPVPDMEVQIYLTVHTPAQELKFVATSTAMFDHLISAFDLGTHYGVPLESPNGRVILHGMLEGRVSVEMRDGDAIAVRVRDHDPTMAAALANGIFEATRSMVKAEQTADLQRQLRVFQQVIDSTERFARIQATELVRLADELRASRAPADVRLARDDRSTEMEEAVMKLANDVAGSNQDLVRQRRNHANLLAIASEQDAGMVRLKSGAMEDIETSPVQSAVQGILLITIIAGAVTALLLLLIIENWFTLGPQPLPVRR